MGNFEQHKPIDWQTAKKFMRKPGSRHEINAMPETPSTQTLARESARRGAPDGSVFVTDRQNSGKGRRDRTWLSLPGKDLTFSVIIRRDMPIKDAPLLSLAVALAVSRAIRKALPAADVSIKWPNDVLIGDRKVCGIICECAGTERLGYAVAGIGINVNRTKEELISCAPQKPVPTSLSAESGRFFDLPELLALVLEELDEASALIESPEGRERLLDSYRAECGTIGRAVTIITEDGNFDCVAYGITDEGAIAVRGIDGGTGKMLKKVFHAADVVHARQSAKP
ncbi:MAG: biotin--[acetyl-CoA-carboxylase] ligase [Synergistaceae bacterium]|nr:biotin--[acetyl-CoA-carboxylase] ligase [Synergistaceae bacterium]